MPIRITPLVSGEYYHVYNRGVASQPTYLIKKDYERFLSCLSYYRFSNSPFKLSHLLQINKDEKEKLLVNLESDNELDIEIIIFCLMPNHFHLLLKQISEQGISRFMKKISDSYTRYFNTRNERIGPVFQGAFKAVHIENDEQLTHLSRYIHLNPLVSFIVRENNFLYYPWSSFKYYVNNISGFVNTSPVLEHFKNSKDYFQFVLDRADYGRELEKIKHLALE